MDEGRSIPKVAAAIITELWKDGTVSVKVLAPEGIYDVHGVSFTESKAGTEDALGKCSWPVTVPAAVEHMTVTGGVGIQL